ncbi:protein of unknown function [Nitrospira japonica]|uniref:Uncharacterized protein n=1 Tax=Nitrospira japonica TaxID=1325564 RepID=A0A1W1I3C5_9BACT|nr:protein of unknown function [Nitrospira japonica]
MCSRLRTPGKGVFGLDPGARGGTRTPTVTHEILSLARLPVPPLSHGGESRSSVKPSQQTGEITRSCRYFVPLDICNCQPILLRGNRYVWGPGSKEIS